MEIANIFNEFCVNVRPSIASKLKKSDYGNKHFLGKKIINSIFLHPVEKNEICKIIKIFDSITFEICWTKICPC